MCALITNMDIPLGYAIGNALEVCEALDVLSGRGPADLTEVCTALATEMVSASLGMRTDDARAAVLDAISSGRALEKFAEWIEAQGGDASYAKDTSLFPKAKYEYDVKAECDGYISAMNAEEIGVSSVVLGAGRLTKDDAIDHAAGIILRKKRGDKVCVGDTIATLYTNNETKIKDAERMLLGAVRISDTKPEAEPLIYKTVR